MQENHNDDQHSKDKKELIAIATQLETMLDRFEELKIPEYIAYLNTNRKLFWINFISGVFRGIGYAFGAVVVFALFLYILQQLAISNVPFIGKYIAQIVSIVENNGSFRH
ncbi:MAG: DUF5665 domain-containing protein [Negativicutes bacterium]